ncbi:MAG: SprT family zinc-dependent metalloprotease [Candidatus Parcubacteria bacterium]|nr:SprT family zinc-dependent metalloprotease [Candidatus Parcubacteria bacterium]
MQDEIKIDRIIRSRRKSIALVVSPEATLIVRAPMRVSLEYIKDLISRKRLWIERKKKQVLKNGAPVKAKEFTDGEEFLYLGEIYKLKIETGKEIKLADYLSFPEKYLTKPRAKMIEWYKQKAREEIVRRVEFFSRLTRWNFKSISITSAQSRWGSCGIKGSINFAWKLVMAPLSVIDYVVVHELAHTVERNHSVGFWNKVEAVLPDYKTRQKWLRNNGANFKI